MANILILNAQAWNFYIQIQTICLQDKKFNIMECMKQKAIVVKSSEDNAELVGLTTVPDLSTAHTIAEVLVKEKLVSCAQVGECVKSFYIWKGEFFSEPEVRIIFKLLKNNENRTLKRLCELHPYECPQWITLRAESLSADYANWLHSNVK